MKPIKLLDISSNQNPRFRDAQLPRARLVCWRDSEAIDRTRYVVEEAEVMDAMGEPVWRRVDVDNASMAIIRDLCKRLGFDAEGSEET